MDSDLFSVKELNNLEKLAECLESGNFKYNTNRINHSYKYAWKFKQGSRDCSAEGYLENVFNASKALENINSFHPYSREDKITKYKVLTASSEAYASIFGAGVYRGLNPSEDQPYNHRSRKVNSAVSIAEKNI